MNTTVKSELLSAGDSNEDVALPSDHISLQTDLQNLDPQQEASDDTTTAAMKFDDQMRSHFARVKSKDAAAENPTATPATSPMDSLSEQLPRVARKGQDESNDDDEGLRPGQIFSASSTNSPLSSVKTTATASQDQDNGDNHQASCTCDDDGTSCGHGNSQQHSADVKKCEPWWWVMRTVFYYLVYCVYCDFATAVQNGSQVSRLYNGGRGSSSSNFIMFSSWWQFMRFILAMMYLGRCASSGAAWLAIAGKVEVAAVWIDRVVKTGGNESEDGKA